MTSDSGLVCRNCNAGLIPSERFCGHCGREVSVGASQRGDSFEFLKPALLYYSLILLLLALYKFTGIFPEGFEGLIYVTILDIVITVPFFFYYRDSLMNSMFGVRISVAVLGAVLIGALMGAVVVTFLANFINRSVFDDVLYAPYIFQETNSPLLWTILFTCLMPAIFEELAFRGFLYDSLKEVTTEQGAVYITSFVFGVIHLTFISLIWLVPLGLAFGWLRLKYKTLWYGMAGHFAYNFFVSVSDFL